MEKSKTSDKEFYLIDLYIEKITEKLMMFL